jgi:Peptidase_C39 like family
MMNDNTTKWKQQHYNNSCASACLAMLLSHRGIDKQDTDVIKETEMQYLIQLDQANMCYKAGVLVQKKKHFNILLKKYGLKLSEYKVREWNRYIDIVDDLLGNSQPFMTGVKAQYLPNRAGNSVGSGSHAVVVYEKNEGLLYRCFDPDAGLDRQVEHDFKDIQSIVSFDLPLDQFCKAIIERGADYPYIIGYLEELDNDPEDLEQILQESRQAISQYMDCARKELDLLKLVNNIPDYKGFYDFIINIVKPIAMDLNTAIKVSDKESVESCHIIAALDNYKKTVLTYQMEIKNGALADWEQVKENLLLEISDIQSIIISHINRGITRYNKHI